MPKVLVDLELLRALLLAANDSVLGFQGSKHRLNNAIVEFTNSVNLNKDIVVEK